MTFKCIECSVHPLVFDGLDEYGPHPDTGETSCFILCYENNYPDHSYWILIL